MRTKKTSKVYFLIIFIGRDRWYWNRSGNDIGEYAMGGGNKNDAGIDELMTVLTARYALNPPLINA